MIEKVRKHARDMVREFGFFKNQYEDTGASYGESHALIELQRLGPLEVGELARCLNVDKSQSSKMLSQLRRKSWVEESASKQRDARKKVFQLTSEGLEVTARIEAYANQKVKGAFDELSTEEQSIVEQGLANLAKSLKLARARRDYTIRKCREEDNSEIASIVRRSIKDFGFEGPGTAAQDPSLNYLSSFNAGRQCYYVATKEDRVVGGAGIAEIPGEKADVAELIRMFIKPEARATGVAQLLLTTVLHEAVNLGYTRVYLETTQEMKAAQKLYIRNGFSYVDKRRGNSGHFACTVLMEKVL